MHTEARGLRWDSVLPQSSVLATCLKVRGDLGEEATQLGSLIVGEEADDHVLYACRAELPYPVDAFGW